MKTTRALKPGFSLLFVLAGLLLINGCGGDDGNEEGCGSDPDAFCVESDDQSLAATYNASYDWSSDKIAVRYMTAPTRSEAEKALYFQNPGLYQNPGQEPQITPDPPLTLDPSPSGFDFELSDLAPNPNTQLLDNNSIVNSLGETSITQAEQDNAPLWLPAVLVYLSVDWDASKVLNLYYGNTAVKGQKWGATGTNVLPQTIQHMYLHNGEIWVEIAFENHVVLDAGITDSNGDGYKEIFGKIDPAHFTSEVFDELANNYVGTRMSVAELDGLIENKILDDLYSLFYMKPHSDLGIPFEVTGAGTVKYPFKVLSDGSEDPFIFIVLIVEP